MSTPKPAIPPAVQPGANDKPCPDCGAIINKKAEICPKCGVHQKGNVNKVALVLLTFFGGGIGLHKFYLRKPVQGILYLLFFWTLIPSLIALVEFIIYISTPDERLNEKYSAASVGMVVLFGAVGGFVLFFLVGILAAIAIPAYQDYTLRARVAAAIQQAEPLRLKVQQQILQAGAIPSSPLEASTVELPGLGTAQAGNNGTIVIQFAPSLRPIAQNTVELTPRIEGNQLAWGCDGGTLPLKYRPMQCRATPVAR